MLKTTRKKRLLTRKGIFAANFSPMAIALFVLIGTIFAVVFATSTGSMLTGSKLSTAIDEANSIDAMVKEYSVIGTARGSGYANLTSEAATPYSATGLKTNGVAGAASRIVSGTSFGTKINYDVKPNTSNETYNILIDASAAWSGWDDEQRVKYVTGIARAYQKMNMRPADNIGNVVVLSGTAASTNVTAIPATAITNAGIAGDDGIFTIVYLGK